MSRRSSSAGDVLDVPAERRRVDPRSRSLSATRRGRSTAFLRLREGPHEHVSRVLTRKDDTTVVWRDDQRDPPEYKWCFVFDVDAEEAAIYQKTVEPMVEGITRGQSGVLILHGISGSGKTRTLMGVKGRQPGVAQLAVRELFAKTAAEGTAIAVQYLEVTPDGKTYRLLKDGTKEDVAKDVHGSVFQKIISWKWQPLQTAEEACKLVEKLHARRTTGPTVHNQESSRANGLLILRAKKGDREALLVFADIAGSEANVEGETLTAEESSIRGHRRDSVEWTIANQALLDTLDPGNAVAVECVEAFAQFLLHAGWRSAFRRDSAVVTSEEFQGLGNNGLNIEKMWTFLPVCRTEVLYRSYSFISNKILVFNPDQREPVRAAAVREVVGNIRNAIEVPAGQYLAGQWWNFAAIDSTSQRSLMKQTLARIPEASFVINLPAGREADQPLPRPAVVGVGEALPGPVHPIPPEPRVQPGGDVRPEEDIEEVVPVQDVPQPVQFIDHVQMVEAPNVRNELVHLREALGLDTLPKRCPYAPCPARPKEHKNFFVHVLSKHFEDRRQRFEYKCHRCGFSNADRGKYRTHVTTVHPEVEIRDLERRRDVTELNILREMASELDLVPDVDSDD